MGRDPNHTHLGDSQASQGLILHAANQYTKFEV